jgi:zinc protease
MRGRAGAAAPKRACLDNGLVVVVRPNRATRSVAARLVLEAGSAFDPQGKAGLAALLARLLDRGAGPLSARQIADGFDFIGATCVARSFKDSLEIEARLLAEHLPDVLERLRLLAAEPSFPPEEMERERGQTLTAIAEREQDTSAVADEALASAIYPPEHPYHAPEIGTRDSVRAIRREDLADAHRRRFGPSGAVLALAGDFDPESTVDLAARVFGSWVRGGPGGRRAAFPDPPPPARAVVVVRPIPGKTQADLALGFPGPRRLSPDLPAVLVLNSILGEFGLGGRLAHAIRDQAGLAYYAFSYCSPGLGSRPITVRAGVAPDGVKRAVGLMRRTIAGLVKRGVTPAEVGDSRRALASSVPRRLETNQGAAAFLADCEFQGLGIDYPDRLPGLIEAVRRPEVEEAAFRYVTPASNVLVVAGPDLAPETLA